MKGLSPLARGTRLDEKPARAGKRFIPAGAGNTVIQSPIENLKTVYPRWRGEHTKYI